MPPRKKTNAAFEDNLEALEAVVKRLEEGDMPLSESLKAYEEGMRLAGLLNGELEKAETRMKEISGGRTVPMEDAP